MVYQLMFAIITPALIAGVSCYAMVAKVKATLGYDDLLDAFGVHGAGGRC
jgi:ammonia channel protein AmtB